MLSWNNPADAHYEFQGRVLLHAAGSLFRIADSPASHGPSLLSRAGCELACSLQCTSAVGRAMQSLQQKGRRTWARQVPALSSRIHVNSFICEKADSFARRLISIRCRLLACMPSLGYWCCRNVDTITPAKNTPTLAAPGY